MSANYTYRIVLSVIYLLIFPFVEISKSSTDELLNFEGN